MADDRAYDVIGVGFGPANLSLAIAIEEDAPELSRCFLESQAEPVWQDQMLLDGSDIQNHPCRDLVTLRNPRSRYSFINHLHETGRLLAHLNLPLEFPLRKDYAKYIEWVTAQLSSVAVLGERVTSVELVSRGGHELVRLVSASGREHLGHSLVLATGRTPYVPEPMRRLGSPRVIHTQRYLSTIRGLQEPPASIAVIGGSQSAVEVILDLMRRFPSSAIQCYTRSFGYRLKDTSPFSEEGFFPEFIDYYYRASRSSKRTLDAYMRPTNYSCVDGDVLNELYVRLYEQRLDGEERVRIRPNRYIKAAELVGDRVSLQMEELHHGGVEHGSFDLVVLATGFRDLGPEERNEPHPPVLGGIIDRFEFDADGHLRIERDYSLVAKDPRTPPVFLNGLCESSHGIGDAGAFSLLSLRAKEILDAIRARRR